MALSDLGELGEDLTARFELGELLGRGGFGAVHRAVERATGRPVALKLLQVENPTSLERFIREARLAASLDHPAVVPAGRPSSSRAGSRGATRSTGRRSGRAA